MEEADFDRVEAGATEFGFGLTELQEAENRAYEWVHQLSAELSV